MKKVVVNVFIFLILFIAVDYISAYLKYKENEKWFHIRLEKEGFIIYDLKTRLKENITSNKYTVYDEHPNAEAWDLVIKNLVKDLKLN